MIFIHCYYMSSLAEVLDLCFKIKRWILIKSLTALAQIKLKLMLSKDLSSKEMGFLNPNSPFFGERGGAV